MAHITTFNNQPGATFTDNSLTVNAQQNNTQFNTENRIVEPLNGNKAETDKEQPKTKPIRLNPDIDKIDFIRVINAMCEYGFFTTPAGTKAYKKDVFAALGILLDENFSNYQKNLSESRGVNNDSPATTKIFEDLRDIALHYIEK